VTPVHTAVVVDEFGTLQGIVTRTDLLEAVAGDLPKIDSPTKPKITRREDGSFLLDAFVPFAEVMQLIGVTDPQAGDYVSLAGFVLSQLHELPKPGDHFTWKGWRFEVVDTDGRRIDMILLQRQPAQ
jgi:CBS domain containing-hemolysin-like protein